MKGSVSEPSEHVVGFSSVERVVAAVSCHHTFIIIIYDLIMPNSDFKYYAVGVVPCNGQKKHQLLQRISCGHKIVYNEPHLSSSSARFQLRPLYGPLPKWGSSCARNCFGNIYGSNFMKNIFTYRTLGLRYTKKPE